MKAKSSKDLRDQAKKEAANAKQLEQGISVLQQQVDAATDRSDCLFKGADSIDKQFEQIQKAAQKGKKRRGRKPTTKALGKKKKKKKATSKKPSKKKATSKPSKKKATSKPSKKKTTKAPKKKATPKKKSTSKKSKKSKSTTKRAKNSTSLRELVLKILGQNRGGLELKELVTACREAGYKSNTKGGKESFSQIVYQTLYKLMKKDKAVTKVNKKYKKVA